MNFKSELPRNFLGSKSHIFHCGIWSALNSNSQRVYMSKSLTQLIMLEMKFPNKISKFPLPSTFLDFHPTSISIHNPILQKLPETCSECPSVRITKGRIYLLDFFWVGNERGYVFNFALILILHLILHQVTISVRLQVSSPVCLVTDRRIPCHSQMFRVTSRKSKRCLDSLLQRHHHFHSRKPLPYGMLEHQRFDLILFNFMNNHRTNILCFTLKKILSQIILYLPVKKVSEM